jgi:adenylate cyclase
LLHVIFPKSIAAELKEHNRVKPRHHPNVAVLFCDITGFTSYCDQNPPEVVIDNLQKLVRSFEEIAERHGVEKIKTIGDAFMATAGRYTSVSTRARLFSGVVGERSYHFDVWGDTVNTAARVADLAGDAGVALSEHAWSTVDHLCTGTSAGQFQVKGEMEVFKVTADTPPMG